IPSSLLESQPTELAALGRPLFLGMLYDSRKDSFIPGVTLWDKKSLSENLDSRPQPLTDLKFSSSDSMSSKASLLDVSASLKASFLGGLVEVGGSAKFLRDTKSSNQQSRVTMYHSETSRFEQLTMTHLGKITYPQVFDQKTATHVVTAVLYGAQTFMVFDQTISEEENKQEVEGELNLMVNKIPLFSIEGKAALEMTDFEKKRAEKITCTFHGDISLKQNPTTYMEALNLFKELPTLLKENHQKMVPIKVWLYPLNLLDTRAARMEREISTSIVSSAEDIMEGLLEAERICNDLSESTLVNAFSDIKERLRSFQSSFKIYKSMLLKAFGRVLPAIREGGMEEKSLEDILRIHRSSPFNVGKLNQWLNDAKSELNLLKSFTNTLKGIKMEDPDCLNSILIDPNTDFVVSLTFTSLQYEDPYLSTLKEFLKSDKFKEIDEENNVPVSSVKKWFNNPNVITNMREDISRFRSFSEANKKNKRIRFIISAISDPSSLGSSIYLYEKGRLTDTKYQLVSKPLPPVRDVKVQTVALKLHESPTGETLKYRVEYKELKSSPEGRDEQWISIETTDKDITLTGLAYRKQYTVRCRAVDKVGMSEASDTVTPNPSTGNYDLHILMH
uniref:Fibronectin type-III domain-containing protein n=1 Tax=Sinocyclocheilus grahami TaxID=75366 RepID=A0A672KGU8_SINGR